MKRPQLKSALTIAASGGRKIARTTETTATAGRTPARVDKRQIAAWFSPEVGRVLRMLAAEKDTTVQALMAEALNDLFGKYGRPPIA